MIEPCGVGNPKPVIKVKDFSLVKRKTQGGNYEKYVQLGGDGKSINMFGSNIEVLCFGLCQEYRDMKEPDTLNVYGSLEKSYKYGLETYNVLANKIELPNVVQNVVKKDTNLLNDISNLAALL